jgi:hypothetical protein
MRASRIHRLGLIAAVALSLAACVDRGDPTSPSQPAPTPSVHTVAVTLPVASLEVGSAVSAGAIPTNAAGQVISNAQVQWLSSDASVLVVNANGLVSARKMGLAWVYATNDGVAGKISLKVTDSVPFHLLVSPRSTNLKVGAPLQLSASVSTATGRALPGHPTTWKTSDNHYATVSSSGVVTAVGAGTAAIIASTANASDTAYVNVSVAASQAAAPTQPATQPKSTTPTPTTPTPTTPTPTTPAPTTPAPTTPIAPAPTTPTIAPVATNSGSHEPSIMVPIKDWDGHSLGAWSSTTAPKEQFVWDSGLQNTVMQMQYGPVVVPATSTYGPGHLYYLMPGAKYPLHTIYLRVQVKLSGNWKQNSSGVLKLFEVFSGRTWAIPGIHGWGSDLRFMVANDEPTDPNYPGCFIGQIAPSCAAAAPPPDVFTLDQWHTIEVVLVSNTPGISNGRLMTWLDGKLQTSVSNVKWSIVGTDNSFRQLDLNPLWGGLGGTLTSAQTLSVGQIHLSGGSDYLSGTIP